MITNKLYLICINKLIFLLITFLISASNADVINNETIDCKTIDETKFNGKFIHNLSSFIHEINFSNFI